MRKYFPIDNWQQRILWMLVWTALLVFLGHYIPRLYIQYFDTRQYIEITEDVSFDRKVYAPCDTATAKITAKLSVDSEIVTNTRMMKVLTERMPPDNFQIISTTQSTGFVTAQPEPQTYTVDYPIACDLEEGVYLWRAEISHFVSGIKKVEPFQTALISIDKTEKVLRPDNLNLKQVEEMQNRRQQNSQ
jgi:hypothetical protein